MRADRLLSIMMLLQTRGRQTAQQLAGELEVSERTIYRDMEALSMAGIPVYAERGPGGGCALLDSYRTTLTGLTEAEIRALFMLSIPAPLAALGVSQEIRTALLKLSAALPDAQRDAEARTRQRILLDSTAWWFQQESATPHLQTLHRAVWQDRMLHLTYRLPFEGQITRTVSPYGLVAKASKWHLVYERSEQLHVKRASQVLGASLAETTFTRPADFDLSAFWAAWCAGREANRPVLQVVARVSPELLPDLRGHVAPKGDSPARPDANGWQTLTLEFETFAAARAQIMGYGRAIEVLAPEALRLSIIDFAAQITGFYEAREQHPVLKAHLAN
jgi:predicted DNA-binding transcriptional regulator YafY